MAGRAQQGSDGGLFPGVDMLANAIQYEQQEKEEKRHRQQLYLQGLAEKDRQRAAALAAQKEERVREENARRDDTRNQIEIEKLRNSRANLRLGYDKQEWEKQKFQAEQYYKTVVDARNRLQQRASMIQALNMRMYALAMDSQKSGGNGMAEANKQLKGVHNTFSSVRTAIDWWNRQPGVRGQVITDPNNAVFNQIWEIPGIKDSLRDLDPSQRELVQKRLAQYASLPEDQRQQYMSQLDNDEKTAGSMVQVYSGFQDPKAAMEFVNSVVEKTNNDVNALYAQMPSFYGFDGTRYQQGVQPAASSKSTGQSVWNSVQSSAQPQQQEPSSDTYTPTREDRQATDDGTNSEGYYEDDESDDQ